MRTSTEQLHHGRLNAEPRPGADSRLYIDLDICASAQCEVCNVGCSYFYHPGNKGPLSLAELATYVLVCRRCEEPDCVNACPKEALEQQEKKGKILVRHNMRCVGCRSCSHACPYGTIYPEYVRFITHNCDFCLGRLEDENEPLCVKTCEHEALRVEPGSLQLDENTFLVGDNLIVHSTHWHRERV